ncbi:MAG: UvrD-helicase domain-containing protein [Pseudohongiellaceae bacterium]
MSTKLPDQPARDQALDIGRSFIVQAPAGSGKTALLTLRYLRLLSACEQPEQVLAITFTKKAASEMRERILQTLYWAQEIDSSEDSPSGQFDQQRLEIARDVLNKDKQKDWYLLENPSRLRVQTIDSFCFYLASQLPVLSRIGGDPSVTEDVDQCFRDAIANTLKQLDQGNHISADLERVQIHLDNDLSRLERLLKNLLYNRDQWLPYILEIGNSNDEAKTYLQNCLEELVSESIAEAKTGLQAFEPTILELTNFALGNFKREEPPQYAKLNQFSAIPADSNKDRPSWSFILNLFLTKEGGWRRIVNVRNGFPTGDKTNKDHQTLCSLRKQQFLELKDKLLEQDDLLQSLNYVRLLPDASADNRQWEFLTSLTRVLAQLSSELLLSFRRFRLIDYTQTGAAARAAIDSDTNPTDLALTLDHRIQHILVDEFQDTSQLQLDILQQLTVGWETGDQRSIFLVGDAMQSCYGFRNANVGIYLNVQQNGFPNISIQPLFLSANFRSQAGIVNWVNRHFTSAFPSEPNLSRGAVPYSYSMATKAADKNTAISTEIISYNSQERVAARQAEAKQVIAHIKQLRQQGKVLNESIAILVRSRGHLEYIVRELRDSNISWESNDIDRMGALQVIQDLLSLTKALLNPYDRLSWFAILRAPWLGLTTSDLHAIAQFGGDNAVWKTISRWREIPNLSQCGTDRLERFVDNIAYSVAFRYRTSLRELIETTWNLLRGSAAIETNRETACINLYFDLLTTHEYAGGLNNLELFQELVFDSFIPAQQQISIKDTETPVQLLTMHKAKGLEFDHVIIPALANRSRSDEKPLFVWHERLNSNGQARLFFAALSATGNDEDSLYTLLRHEKEHKTLLENTRLLYIAITRAKKSAKLFATVGLSNSNQLLISSNSLLGRIWRELERETNGLNMVSLKSLIGATAGKKQDKNNEPPSPTPIRRFQTLQKLDDAELNYLTELNQQSDSEEYNSYEQESNLTASIGEIIHQELEDYANDEQKQSYLKSLSTKRAYWSLQLRNTTDSKQELTDSLKMITESLQKTLEDEDINWIFNNNQKECQSELSISSLHKGKIRNHIIDRTFIDEENVRWIIDYKSSRPKGDESKFIKDQTNKHEPQLRRYKRLFEAMEDRTIKMALVLTAIPKLVEIKSPQ